MSFSRLVPRFGETMTDGYTLFDMPNPTQTLIHVHRSDGDLNKVVAATVPIHGTPESFLEQVSKAMLPASDARTAWRAEARAAFVASHDLPEAPGPLDMATIVRHLEDVLPDDAILTNGAGNFAIWPSRIFRFRGTQRLLGPQSGAMGAGVPAAVAAKAAFPHRMVVCFAGDGDFQMTGLELSAAQQAGCPPIVLILNNGMYGTIRMHQEREYPHRVAGTRIDNPDFVALGAALGYHAERVVRTEEFAATWERAAAAPKGAVIEIMVNPEAITPSKTMSDIRGTA